MKKEYWNEIVLDNQGSIPSVTIPSFPTIITALKLRVSVGSITYEQPISSATLGNNSIKITESSLLAAFNNAVPGTIFSYSIATTYSGFPTENTITTNSASNFVPRKIPTVVTIDEIPPELSLPELDLSDYIRSNNNANLSYVSSDPSILIVDSNGEIHYTGLDGDVNLIITQPESPDGVYMPVFTTLTLRTPQRLAR